MKRVGLLFIGLLLFPALLHAENKKRPMTIEDMFRFQRLSDAQISPDGKLVAYVVGDVDLQANKLTSTLWLAPVDGGGQPRQLTNTTKKDRHPRWSPDGKHILFESSRSGDNQLWIIDLSGGEARQLTSIATEASNGIWSPDGKTIAFVSAVWPEYASQPYKESNAANKKRKEENEASPVKAKTFTRLFYRHWDEYVEDKRQHLFVMPAGGGEPLDVTPWDRDAYPTSDTFSSGEDFTFSPDSKHLVFTATPEKGEAWTTNYEICRVSVEGGKIDCLTAENKAADSGPRFSPDGKHLAYRAQKRPGFEADRWELMVVDTDASGSWMGKPRSLTPEFDSWVDTFAWQDPQTICFSAEKEATKPVWKVTLKSGDVKRLEWLQDVIPAKAGSCNGFTFSKDGKRMACDLVSMRFPVQIWTAIEKNGVFALGILPSANDKLLAELDLPRPESVTVKGDGGTPMQMWILKPPGFDPKKKWPVAFLVHGGPQGAWEDGWSYRWNPELWAAQGYVVVLPNPRGSTGFGQKYLDEISGDWGGKCFNDLMAGADYVEKLPYVDKDRMAAAGASFGGYMMDWFAGHTDRFKTLITHCGVYNFESMYALTDELWFDEWEHGGTPWEKLEDYVKFSPHRYAKNFKTPMLIIHNDLDFRVPVAEGHQLFTTLQRRGIPSKFINFPDEGHWVLKPKNSEYWHKEVFAWLAKYCPPGGR
jgi:dipeptidyl aminopeptidase/acylaminoacyl peptidase